MLRLTVNFLLTFVVLMALAFDTTIGQINDSYKALNIILKRQTDTDDIQANLAVALQQLQRVNRNYELHLPGNEDERQLIETLDEFIGAIELSSRANLNCDQMEHAVLAPMATNTNGLRYYTELEAQNLDRLDSIAHQLLSNYASRCMPQYPLKLHSKAYEVKAKSRIIVESLLGQLVDCDSNLSPKECMNWLATRDPFDLTAKHIADRIMEVSSNDPDRSIISYTYHEYFFEPCQDYVWILGPDVFNPALFLAHKYENLEAAYNNLEDPNLLDYFRTMAKFNFCGATIHDARFEEEVKRLLKSGMA